MKMNGNGNGWIETPEKTLELLEDQEWHTINEISEEAFSEGNGVEKVLQHLDEIGIVEFDRKKKEARINEIGLEILELPQV